MTLTLEVEDSKLESFMEVLKKMDYVKVKKKAKKSEKERIISSLKQAVEEVKMHQRGEIELQSWDDFMIELKNEGAL